MAPLCAGQGEEGIGEERAGRRKREEIWKGRRKKAREENGGGGYVWKKREGGNKEGRIGEELWKEGDGRKEEEVEREGIMEEEWMKGARAEGGKVVKA